MYWSKTPIASLRAKPGYRKGIYRIIVAIALLLLAMVVFWIARPIERLTMALASSGIDTNRLSSNAEITGFLSQDKSELVDYILQLEQQLDAQKITNADLEIALLQQKTSGVRVPVTPLGAAKTNALVLRRPGLLWMDSILIDKGFDDGVTEGDLVTLPKQTAVLGEVVRVYDTAAAVRLFSHTRTDMPVLLHALGIEAQLIGQGNGQMSLMLPREVQMEIGDLVTMTTAQDALVGLVTAVVAQEQDPLQNVHVHAPANIYGLRQVSIVPAPQNRDYELITVPSELDPQPEIADDADSS